MLALIVVGVLWAPSAELADANAGATALAYERYLTVSQQELRLMLAQNAGLKVRAAHDQKLQAAAKKVADRRVAYQRAARSATRDPRGVARLLMAGYGWNSDGQFSCLDSLWNKESKWNYRATNRSSGAYGIPQALPGSKMATAGSDWRTNPVTQIRWGLGYIKGRYGTPCSAWGFSQAHNWY